MLQPIITTLAFGLLCLLGSLWAQEPPAHSQMGKGPLRIFILAGQSNMEGHGQNTHIKMAAADGATRKEFSPLMNGETFIVRKDVWISYGGRRGGLSVGYGAGDENIGPEIGFGWHIGELLDEQVLLIKTAWGGHSLKEMFLPPSMGGPGPSYTQMVKEVRDLLDNLKTHFPGYAESMGYEIIGLVWHQAWNDMIDDEQRSETPPFKLYSDRQGALLRDLRKEFKAPQMLMTIGEAGFDGEAANGDVLTFRKGQEATALTEEFRKTMRYVKTRQFWDEDVRYKSNEGYHYNGNGKTYYFMGKAMALAMYDLIPKLTFRDVKGYLDEQSKPAYAAIKAKKFPEAVSAVVDYKEYVADLNGKLTDDLYKKKVEVLDALTRELLGAINPAVDEIASLRAIGDYYALSIRFPVLKKIFKGVPAFDLAADGLEEQLKSKEIISEIKVGKVFYENIASFRSTESDPKFTRSEVYAKGYAGVLTSQVIKKYPESRYAKAAAKAIEELKVLTNPVLDPQGYMSIIR